VNRWALPLLMLASLLVSCKGTTRAPRDSIRFEHSTHIASGATCADCHAGAVPLAEGADASTAEVLPIFPSEEKCKSCHESEDQRRCAYCHTEPRHAATYGGHERDLRFDHRMHRDAPPGGCVGCHGVGVSQASIAAFRPNIPPMITCTGSCHAQQMRDLECSLCHTSLHRYRMEDLETVRHTASWGDNHGTQARGQGELCAQCHEPSYCSRCHTGTPGLPLELYEPMEVSRDFVHRGDWISRHPSEARLAQGTCLRCHGVGFCDGCHHERGVGGSVAPESPHPPGWLDAVSFQGHARSARRDILSCAACHESDAESTCVPCHRVGGFASNPHPPGFGGGMDPNRHGICRVCHSGEP